MNKTGVEERRREEARNSCTQRSGSPWQREWNHVRCIVSWMDLMQERPLGLHTARAAARLCSLASCAPWPPVLGSSRRFASSSVPTCTGAVCMLQHRCYQMQVSGGAGCCVWACNLVLSSCSQPLIVSIRSTELSVQGQMHHVLQCRSPAAAVWAVAYAVHHQC